MTSGKPPIAKVMWAVLSTMNSSAKKRNGSLHHHGEVDFELWVMLIAEDQGQPHTTYLYRESYMGNMGPNQSFWNPQGPCNSREITQSGESGIGSNYNNDNVPKPEDIRIPLTRVPVHLTPASSDKGVPKTTIADPILRSTVIHVKKACQTVPCSI